MRLNRFLAAAGLGSRRSCEELIRTGQVTVNGAECSNLATQVEPTDVVKVGNRVLHSAPPVTLLLHKPPGFLCTAADTHERRTIFDLLPSNFPRLFHVGRLDKESEGLLILTNDGELALKLTHPRFKIEKEYEVVLDKPFDFADVEKLLHGMKLEEGWAKVESVHRIAANKVKTVLRQGMKRQIRLMFYELGYEVNKLVRTRIGPIRIEGIPAGHWRALTHKEIENLVTSAEHAEATPSLDKPNASAHETHESRPRTARPIRKPVGLRGPQAKSPRSDRPQGPRNPEGKLEEIPFTPRASRNPDSTRKPVRHAERTERGPSRSHKEESEQIRKPLAPGWNRVDRRPRRPFNRPDAAEPDYQDDERPRHQAEQERPVGKPSKQFVSKFFASNKAKGVSGKTFGGKPGGGAKHKPGSRSPHGARNKRPSR